MQDNYAFAPRVGGIKRWGASDVWRLSVCRVHRAKVESREAYRKTEIGIQVSHVTRDSDTTFKVKRSKVKLQGRGILWRPAAQLVKSVVTRRVFRSQNSRNSLTAGVRPSPFEELTQLPRSPSWTKGRESFVAPACTSVVSCCIKSRIVWHSDSCLPRLACNVDP